eukprot:3066745-Pleurochrysis_carterae.AAC.2
MTPKTSASELVSETLGREVQERGVGANPFQRVRASALSVEEESRRERTNASGRATGESV